MVWLKGNSRCGGEWRVPGPHDVHNTPIMSFPGTNLAVKQLPNAIMVYTWIHGENGSPSD